MRYLSGKRFFVAHRAIRVFTLFIVFALYSNTVFCADQPTTSEAQALFEQARQEAHTQHYTRAWALLYQLLDSDYPGSEEYDYLFGMVSNRTGKPQHAIFALQRLLETHPDHQAGRAELAHAYFLVGEIESARHHFKQIDRQQLPEEVTRTIDRFLSAIDLRIARRDSNLIGSFAVGAGLDSNINSATEKSIINVPGGVFTIIDPMSLEQDSSILKADGNLDYVYSLKKNLQLIMKAGMDIYHPVDESSFATRAIELSAGTQYLAGIDQYQFSLSLHNFAVDGDSFRNLGGFNVGYLRTLDAHNQMRSFAQYARIRFSTSNDALDTDQLSAGLTWIHSSMARFYPVFYLSAFVSSDEATDSTNDFNSSRTLGGKLGGILNVTRHTSLQAGITYQSRDFDTPVALFGEERSEQYFNLILAHVYRLTTDSEIRSELQHSRNDANIDLYDFDRNQLLISYRKNF